MKNIFEIIIILLLFLFKPGAYSQSVCDPILIIDNSYMNKNFMARFENCFDNSPIVRVNINPTERARLIKKYKIKEIKKTLVYTYTDNNLSDTITIEKYDENGYIMHTSHYKSDSQTLEIIHKNKFDTDGYLIKCKRYKKRKSNFISDLFGIYFVDEYKYDERTNLIKYSNKRHNGFAQRKSKFTHDYIYDKNNNLIEVKGLKKIEYDNLNRQKRAIEINIYAPGKRKVIYANRQFHVFSYDSVSNIVNIKYCHFDSLTFKNYERTFKYDSLNRVVEIIKYHGDGRYWTIQKFDYNGNFLSKETNTMYSGTSNNSNTYTTKYYYKKGLVYKKEEYYNLDRKNCEINYEYQFY